MAFRPPRRFGKSDTIKGGVEILKKVKNKYLKLARQDYEDLYRDEDMILYLAELLEQIAELKSHIKFITGNEVDLENLTKN